MESGHLVSAVIVSIGLRQVEKIAKLVFRTNWTGGSSFYFFPPFANHTDQPDGQLSVMTVAHASAFSPGALVVCFTQIAKLDGQSAVNHWLDRLPVDQKAARRERNHEIDNTKSPATSLTAAKWIRGWLRWLLFSFCLFWQCWPALFIISFSTTTSWTHFDGRTKETRRRPLYIRFCRYFVGRLWKRELVGWCDDYNTHQSQTVCVCVWLHPVAGNR